MNGTTSYKEYVARSYQVMAEDGWDFDWTTGCMVKEGSPPVPVLPSDRQSAFIGCHWAKLEAAEAQREGPPMVSRIPALGQAWLDVGQERALVSIEMLRADDWDYGGHLRWRVRLLVRAARHAARMQRQTDDDVEALQQTIDGFRSWHYGKGQHGPASHTG